eukprot:jgi/Chlat1/307/Chrsp1S03067
MANDDDRRPGGGNDVRRPDPQGKDEKGGRTSQVPSRHLWVGNLDKRVTDAELAGYFARFGEIESVSIYPEKSFGFVNFFSIRDAKQAMPALHGTLIRGLAIRIEYAKAGKPTRTLVVGNVGRDVNYDKLYTEFKQFGTIQNLNLVKERHYALIEYDMVEEAIAAQQALNGKRVGNDSLAIDFKAPGRSAGRVPEPPMPGRDGYPFQGPPQGDEHPSACLWISFSDSKHVNDEMLRRYFEPFGPLEYIRMFPGRTYAFVQFMHMQDSLMAKDRMQNQYVGGGRLQIRFSRSELSHSPASDVPGLVRLAPHPQTPPGHHASIPPGHLGPGGPHFHNPEYGLLPGGGGPRQPTLGPRPPPGPRPLAPAGPMPVSRGPTFPNIPANLRPLDDGRDGLHEIGPDKKRMRIVGTDAPGPGFDNRPPPQQYGVQSNGPSGPSPIRPASDGTIWHGVFAKSGTPACRAKGYAVSRSIHVAMPDVINCTARTDLDTLARHLQADFAVVYFLPESRDDIGAYQDFMQYLGEKNRAAVARWGDVTLFVVPPSSFSRDVLKVPRTDCIFGVIVTPQGAPSVGPRPGSEGLLATPPQQLGMQPGQAAARPHMPPGAQVGPPPQFHPPEQQRPQYVGFPQSGMAPGQSAPPPALTSQQLLEILARAQQQAPPGQQQAQQPLPPQPNMPPLAQQRYAQQQQQPTGMPPPGMPPHQPPLHSMQHPPPLPKQPHPAQLQQHRPPQQPPHFAHPAQNLPLAQQQQQAPSLPMHVPQHPQQLQAPVQLPADQLTQLTAMLTGGAQQQQQQQQQAPMSGGMPGAPPAQHPAGTAEGGDDEEQKQRFQATLQLAAAFLQQITDQQPPPQGT